MCPSFHLRACISLFPVCAVRICVYLFVYACTCSTKHAPPLCAITTQRRRRFVSPLALAYRDSPSLFRLSLRIVALVASLRLVVASVSRYQCAFETSLWFSARTKKKKKKNPILLRIIRFFNQKFHTSTRNETRFLRDVYFRGTCKHAIGKRWW